MKAAGRVLSESVIDKAIEARKEVALLGEELANASVRFITGTFAEQNPAAQAELAARRARTNPMANQPFAGADSQDIMRRGLLQGPTAENIAKIQAEAQMLSDLAILDAKIAALPNTVNVTAGPFANPLRGTAAGYARGLPGFEGYQSRLPIDISLAQAQNRIAAPRNIVDDKAVEASVKALSELSVKADFNNLHAAEFTDQLKEQVRLAGLLPEEREKELTLMQAQEVAGRALTDNEKADIEVLVRQRQETQKVTDASQEYASAIINGLSGLEESGAKASHVFQTLEQNIARVTMKLLIMEPLEKAIKEGLDSIGGVGGIWDAIFGMTVPDIGTVDPSQIPLPGFASGGRPTGPSWVGENGPELFIPDAPGTIVPANRIGGGGPNVTVNQVISISPDVSAVARGEIAKQLPQIRAHVVLGVQQALKRGGF